MMTPLHWNLLLHYYAIAEPYAAGDPAHANSRAVREYTAELVREDLIKADEASGSGYRATIRGEVLVDHIDRWTRNMKRFLCWLLRHRFKTDDQLEHFWHCQRCGKRNYVPYTE